MVKAWTYYKCLHYSQYQSLPVRETNLPVGAFAKINFNSLQPCLNVILRVLGTMPLDLLKLDKGSWNTIS